MECSADSCNSNTFEIMSSLISACDNYHSIKRQEISFFNDSGEP